jgi:hypothetical protein
VIKKYSKNGLKMQPLYKLSAQDITEVLQAQTAKNLVCLKKLGIIVN